jgi:hypothetical protein
MEMVKEIMAKVLSKQSTNKFAGQISIFAISLYDSAELCVFLLESLFVWELDVLVTATQRKKHVKQHCLEMSPDNENCPFMLSNLTLIHFSTFVTPWKARKGKHRGNAMSLCNASYEQCQSALKDTYTMEPDFIVKH